METAPIQGEMESIPEGNASAPNDDIYAQMDDLLSGQEPKEKPKPKPKKKEPEPEPEQEMESGGFDIDAIESEAEAEPKAEKKTEIDYKKEFEVPMPEGIETANIGQLKDAYVNQQKISNEQAENSNKLMVQRQELTELIEYIGVKNLNPQAQAKVKAMQNATLQRENVKMMQAIPEWKDNITFQTDRSEMLDLSGQYGIGENDVNGISDHRWIKMLRDYTKLKAQFKKTQQTFEKNKTSSRKIKKPSKAKRKEASFNHAVKSNSQSEKLQAIDDLIK